MLASESAGCGGGPQRAEQDHKSGRGDGPAQHRERERRQTENKSAENFQQRNPWRPLRDRAPTERFDCIGLDLHGRRRG